MQTEMKLSIPEGAIDTNSQQKERDVLSNFQYPKVRLIRECRVELVADPVILFQYPKVRLILPTSEVYSALRILLSIPEGAIDTFVARSKSISPVPFQYPKVRLIPLTVQRSTVGAGCLSIPEGAIDTIDLSLARDTYVYFQYPKVRLILPFGWFCLITT